MLGHQDIHPADSTLSTSKSPEAELYRMIMRARRDGEPEPTELPPEVKARYTKGGGGGGRRSTGGGAPMGFGSSDMRANETAVERERRLRREAASERLKAKGFNVGRGMGGSRMGGIGSDGRSFVPPANGGGGAGLVLWRDGLHPLHRGVHACCCRPRVCRLTTFSLDLSPSPPPLPRSPLIHRSGDVLSWLGSAASDAVSAVQNKDNWDSLARKAEAARAGVVNRVKEADWDGMRKTTVDSVSGLVLVLGGWGCLISVASAPLMTD